MQSRSIQRTLLVALPLGILIGAAGAYAANRYLDEADGHIDKAMQSLQKAAKPVGAGHYGGHRKRAIDALEEAKRHIRKAKEFDDRHPGPRPDPEPRPDAGPVPVPSGHPGPQPKPRPTVGPSKPLPTPTGPSKPRPSPTGGPVKPSAPNNGAKK